MFGSSREDDLLSKLKTCVGALKQEPPSRAPPAQTPPPRSNQNHPPTHHPPALPTTTKTTTAHLSFDRQPLNPNYNPQTFTHKAATFDFPISKQPFPKKTYDGGQLPSQYKPRSYNVPEQIEKTKDYGVEEVRAKYKSYGGGDQQRLNTYGEEPFTKARMFREDPAKPRSYAESPVPKVRPYREEPTPKSKTYVQPVTRPKFQGEAGAPPIKYGQPETKFRNYGQADIKQRSYRQSDKTKSYEEIDIKQRAYDRGQQLKKADAKIRKFQYGTGNYRKSQLDEKREQQLPTYPNAQHRQAQVKNDIARRYSMMQIEKTTSPYLQPDSAKPPPKPYQQELEQRRSLFEHESERTPQRPLTTRKEPLAGSIKKQIASMRKQPLQTANPRETYHTAQKQSAFTVSKQQRPLIGRQMLGRSPARTQQHHQNYEEQSSAMEKLRKISELNEKINQRIRNIINVFEDHR